MDSLVNGKPVQFLEMVRDVRARVKIKNSSQSKVLNLLEFGEIRRGSSEKKRVAVVKF